MIMKNFPPLEILYQEGVLSKDLRRNRFSFLIKSCMQTLTRVRFQLEIANIDIQ